MPLSNWPPPMVVIRYKVVLQGNDVYRIERAEVLDERPDKLARDCVLMSGVFHLEDALVTLGIPAEGLWAGFVEGGGGSENDGLRGVECVYTAWKI